jgi:hypothetical protein
MRGTVALPWETSRAGENAHESAGISLPPSGISCTLQGARAHRTPTLGSRLSGVELYRNDETMSVVPCV